MFGKYKVVSTTSFTAVGKAIVYINIAYLASLINAIFMCWTVTPCKEGVVLGGGGGGLVSRISV